MNEYSIMLNDIIVNRAPIRRNPAGESPAGEYNTAEVLKDLRGKIIELLATQEQGNGRGK